MEHNSDRIVGYRMERTGKLFVRQVGGEEREATEAELRALFETRPDLILQLAWQG